MLVGAAFGAVVLAGCSAAYDGVGAIPADATLVFEDNFDDGELDSDHWNTCHWWSVDGGCTIVSNAELQWYQPDNVVESDGVLHLEARIEDVVATDGTPYGYTSGMVTSGPPTSEGDPKFAFTYGFAEARLRVPAGSGFWSAFWLLPASTQSRPEIDVMELYGSTPSISGIRFHGFDRNGERISFRDDIEGEDFSSDWHTFAVSWTPDRLTWLIDGIQVASLDADNDLAIELPSEPLYIVLNLAIDPDAPRPLAGPEAFPAALEVDWVRVWEIPGNE